MIKKIKQLWQFLLNKNLSNVQKSNIYDDINPGFFSGFYNSMNSHLFIRTSFTNIIVLNKTISNCTGWLKNNKRIYQPDVVKDSVTVSVLTFFSYEGNYIDEEAAVVEFCNLAQEYLDVFNKHSKNTDFVDVYNCGVLLKLNAEIKEITQTLIFFQSS